MQRELRTRTIRALMPCLVVIVATLGSTGCGSDSPACPVPTYPYDGYWLGETSEGGDVTVKVVNGLVVQFEADIKWGRWCGRTVGGSRNIAAAIVNQRFSFSVRFGSHSVPVEGQFGSDATLSGSMGGIDFAPDWCNDGQPYSTPPLTFTAGQ